MRIVFRTDASQKIGSGHVMRCLTLAEKLKKNGSDIIFISRAHKGNLNEYIKKKGIDLVELPITYETTLPMIEEERGDYSDWLGVSAEQDYTETIKAIGREMKDWLIIDHYAIDHKWEKALRPYAKKIMVIDDLANRLHDCDLLLDQNWFESKESRYNNLVPSSCIKMLGPKYLLLKPKFYKASKEKKSYSNELKHLFVFFGGSDPHNLTGLTLKALSKSELIHLEIDVVVGSNNSRIDDIKELADIRPGTNLHIQIDNMEEVMARADLAIGSGGVNNWERLSFQIPSIVIISAENQRETINDLYKHKYLYLLGDVNDITIDSFSTVLFEKCINYICNTMHMDNKVSKKLIPYILNN